MVYWILYKHRKYVYVPNVCVGVYTHPPSSSPLSFLATLQLWSSNVQTDQYQSVHGSEHTPTILPSQCLIDEACCAQI